MNIKSWLDYIYYRVTKAYLKWDGRNGNVGILSVAMIEGVLLMDVYVLALSMFYSRAEWKTLPFRLSHIAISTMIILIGVNYRIYIGKYDKYDSLWQDEKKIKKKIKGLLVIASLFLPWFVFFLIDRYTGV